MDVVNVALFIAEFTQHGITDANVDLIFTINHKCK